MEVFHCGRCGKDVKAEDIEDLIDKHISVVHPDLWVPERFRK